MTALPEYETALRRALDGITPCCRTARVSLEDAKERILAEPIVADRDLPPFDRAQMDGYALRAADCVTGRPLAVVGNVPAGSDGRIEVPAGACVAIATGAPLPGDCDAVIPHELSDRGEPTVRFTVDRIERGHAVHPRGADARAGDVLVAPGTRIAAHHLAIAASVGATTLVAVDRPRAVVLTSGDEVVPPDRAPAPHQIRNSNAVLARQLLERCGALAEIGGHVPDEQEPTARAVRAALARADLVVTVGGISAGERDRFPAAFAACGVEMVLRGAAIQPGKPIIVGRVEGGPGTGTGGRRVVVGLPGNPVSVLACACLFAWPIIRRLLGLDPGLPWREVTLTERVRPNARRQAFRPARLTGDWTIMIPRWAGSGDLSHTATTDGLAALPARSDDLAAGEPVRFLPWPS